MERARRRPDLAALLLTRDDLPAVDLAPLYLQAEPDFFGSMADAVRTAGAAALQRLDIGTKTDRMLRSPLVMLAMFLRLLLPSSDVGMLAVRSRRTDVIVLAVLALGLSIFTYWVPAPN